MTTYFSPQAQKKIILYLCILSLLTLSFFVIKSINWEGSRLLTSALDIVIAILTWLVGIVAMIRFYAKKNYRCLFIWIGFLGAALFATWDIMVDMIPELYIGNFPHEGLTWIISSSFLSIYMLFSGFTGLTEYQAYYWKIEREIPIIVMSFVFGVILACFFAYLPLDSLKNSLNVLGIIPGLFFLIALMGYYSETSGQSENFLDWIVIGLLILTIDQLLFYPFSSTSKPLMTAEHLLKIISYCSILIGLLMSLFHLLKENINDQIKTVETLKNTRKRLVKREQLASLGSLTAGIAHEIKNPLNFIINFSILAQERLQNSEKIISKYHAAYTATDKKNLEKDFKEYHEILKTIQDQGKRADNIVKNMLKHSGEQKENPSYTDIHGLIDQYLTLAFHSMRAQNPDFHVKIEKKFDLSIPPIYVIPGDLSRALLNLFDNAFYSMRKKQKLLGPSYSPAIFVKTLKKGDQLEIHIKDNGVGVPENIRSHIFTPFFTTKPVGEGTGLGLSITYDIIVNVHKGMIKIDSKENEYAEFIIILSEHTLKQTH